MAWVCRPYTKSDRNAVRHICCETGFMGNPVDSLFSDREVFADFFTRYYTDWEPENCMVVEAEGRVVGCLAGCIRYRLYPLVQALIIALAVLPKVATRLITFRYSRQSLRFLVWVALRSIAETPKRPPEAAHFHINILPAWRTGVAGRRLIFSFLSSLREQGIGRAYGQIQTYEARRPVTVFERYGFRLFDQRRVSKFERFLPTKVYVSTFCKDL